MFSSIREFSALDLSVSSIYNIYFILYLGTCAEKGIFVSIYGQVLIMVDGMTQSQYTFFVPLTPIHTHTNAVEWKCMGLQKNWHFNVFQRSCLVNLCHVDCGLTSRRSMHHSLTFSVGLNSHNNNITKYSLKWQQQQCNYIRIHDVLKKLDLRFYCVIASICRALEILLIESLVWLGHKRSVGFGENQVYNIPRSKCLNFQYRYKSHQKGFWRPGTYILRKFVNADVSNVWLTAYYHSFMNTHVMQTWNCIKISSAFTFLHTVCCVHSFNPIIHLNKWTTVKPIRNEVIPNEFIHLGRTWQLQAVTIQCLNSLCFHALFISELTLGMMNNFRHNICL